ncbi:MULTISPECIES: MarR family winged helix-turn-helix transcriptional regulator [Gordonia]|uniref:MarR family winged helix-turn-helix transcriptional regulator n=1 Tax=Gordonia TaxID=2053 RepID=UPI0004AE88F3|nr:MULTISPECIES: MarR family transcriptional regulator [Gordonia]ASR05482.1 HTH-type transcriptional repressor NicR [Gordonia rubripertincta]WJG13418.1 MarR family transcriptional regulator [Gordonia sp. Swx-4]
MSTPEPAQLATALRPTITRLYLALRRRAPLVQLTAAQTSALNVLADHGWMRMGELAERESIRMPTATSVIDGLTKHELVERRPDPADRRAVLVDLTAHGRELVDRIRLGRDVALTDALANLSPEHLEALAAAAPALQALRDELDHHPAQTSAAVDANTAWN